MFGVFAPGEDVARMTCFGLQALQHRGRSRRHRRGMVRHHGVEGPGPGHPGVRESRLAALEGYVAVGHARYSTSGAAASWEAAQPHISAIDEILIALAHNGTLVNTNSCAPA